MTSLHRLMLSIALAGATATAAGAYSLSPPDTRARLTGSLTFMPNGGSNPHPFTCQVAMDLKTSAGEKHSAIKHIKFPQGGLCDQVHFGFGPPFRVIIRNATTGVIETGGFNSPDGNCLPQPDQFQDNGSGVWTFVAGCLSGSLNSHPPVTIVP